MEAAQDQEAETFPEALVALVAEVAVGRQDQEAETLALDQEAQVAAFLQKGHVVNAGRISALLRLLQLP